MDHYLGPWPAGQRKPPTEVQTAYDRLIAEWLANGRRLSDAAQDAPRLTVNQLILWQLIWADGGSAGQWIARVQSQCGWLRQTVLRPVGVKGFVLAPRRWGVERTFGCLGRYRRLSKDYERLTATSETMISMAMIHRMSRYLLPESTS